MLSFLLYKIKAISPKKQWFTMIFLGGELSVFIHFCDKFDK